MPAAEVTAAQIEAFLREVGLIPADYNGKVEVTANTSSGSDSITITV